MPPKVTTVWIYSREIIWPHKRFGPKYGANNFSKLELEYCSFSCLLTWRIHPRLTSTMGSNLLWSITSKSNRSSVSLLQFVSFFLTQTLAFQIHWDYTQKNKSHYLFKSLLSSYNHNICFQLAGWCHSPACWKQTNISFEAFLVGNQRWCIKGQMLR